MKRLIALGGILLIGGMFSFYGCQSNKTTIEPPANLALAVAGGDSLSLKLTWDASPTTSIDGYIVYFNDNAIDTVTTTTCTLVPTALGDYKVTAYKGSDESDGATASSKLVEAMNQGPVFMVPSILGGSGFGWASDGSGAAYAVGTVGSRQNTDKVDFVFDSDTSLTDPQTFDAAFQHSTGIAYLDTWTYASLTTAPQSGYLTYKKVVDGGTFALWIQGKYYVKMNVTLSTAKDEKITLKYGFQKIQGFRRLG